MPKFIALLLLLPLLACSHKDPASEVAREVIKNPASPVYEWTSVATREWEIEPGKSENVRFEPTPQMKKLRVSIDAAYSVELVAFKSNCTATPVVKTDVECDVPAEPTTLYVSDTRTLENDAVPAMLGLLSANTKAMDRAIALNRVKLDVFAWTCIANCPLTSPAAAHRSEQ